MNPRQLRNLFCLLVGGCALATPAASAALLSFESTGIYRSLIVLSGNVSQIEDDLASIGITSDQPYSLLFTVDTNTANVTPTDPVESWYSNPLTQLSFTMGGLTMEIPAPVFGSSAITIRNNSSGLPDQWILGANIVPTTPTLATVFLDVLLADPSGGLLAGTSLDDPLPALSEFAPFAVGNPGNSWLSLNMATSGGSFVLYSEILAFRQVPIPAAGWLFLAALATLISRGRTVT